MQTDPGRLRAIVAVCAVAALGTVAAQGPTLEQYDADFARAVREWTTRPEFSSPLVDHLPVIQGIPQPKDILGYHIGAPKKLTSVGDEQRYFRELERSSPRVKTMVVGTTEEGRDILIAFVSSEANIRRLEANRQNLKKLADPRGLSEAEVKAIVASTRPHYHISAGLHSTEYSPPETVIELAYRLAVSEEPYIQRIRENVIVSIAPSTDVDGRERAVEWYRAYKIDEPYDSSESFGGPPYWGKYVFHDNNRDINYGIDSLRAHLNWYLHCRHEFGPGEAKQDERAVHSRHGARDRVGERAVTGRHVEQRTVRFHVLQPLTLGGSDRSQCSDLIHDQILDLLRRRVQFAAAKACQIRKAGVCANRDPMLPC